MIANSTGLPTQRDMRILARNFFTGLYLTQAAQWVRLEKDASDFESFTQVLDLCNLHRFSGCEIHYLFPQSSYNFSIDWKRDAK
jgi:hypothetical protein